MRRFAGLLLTAGFLSGPVAVAGSDAADPPVAAAAVAPASLPPAGPQAAPRTRFEGDVSFQSRWFPEQGTGDEAQFHPSVATDLGLEHDWNGGRDRLTVRAFLRADARDGRRSRGDLREAYYTRLGDGFELHLGLRRVFWGVVESKHLVDVINQVDLVEDLDEETRLGQPMVQLVVPRDAGTLELFWLPVARERTFPSREGRPSGPVIVDGDGRFSVDAGARLRSWALRWRGFTGGLDYGLAHFSGPARDPRFELAAPPVPGHPVRLTAVYETLSRTSLDAQYILGDTALKLELVHRRGQGPTSTAFVAGLEHSLVGVLGTRADLGLLAEYLFDDRGDDAPLLAFEHDVFAGLRLTLNDFAGSTLLAGAIVDHRTGETIVSVEGARRLGRNWRLGFDLRAFSGARRPPLGDVEALFDPGAKWGVLRDEDYLQVELTRYF